MEKRLQEFQTMSPEEVAACKIRKTTSPRVKAAILQAREKVHGSNSKQPKKTVVKELKDGDVLIMQKTKALPQKIISAWTRSPYTHAAVYSKGKVYDSLSPMPGRKYSATSIR